MARPMTMLVTFLIPLCISLLTHRAHAQNYAGGGQQQHGAAGQQVVDLTPDLVDVLAKQRVPIYVTIMEACPKSNTLCSQVNNQFWKPLANMASGAAFSSNIPFFRLDCERYRELCNELDTPARVNHMYQSGGSWDFLAVVYSEHKPNKRIVERFMTDGSSDLSEEYPKYFIDMTSRNDPFEPMLPEKIDVPSSEKRKVDLAVLVLTVDGFTRPDVWKAFLQTQAEDVQVRVFMHNKISMDALQRADGSKSMQELEEVIQVPTITTLRPSISCLRAFLHLIRHAIAYGGATHYLLVSGDSVPLYGAPDILHELTKTNNASRFEAHAQHFKTLTYTRRQYTHLKNDPESWFKSKQWLSLNEQGANFFANPQYDETDNFEITATADEYYWPSVATEYGISYEELPFMYDEWAKEQAFRPLWLDKIDTEDVKFQQGHLFARKITKDTELHLGWLTELVAGESSSTGKDEL